MISIIDYGLGNVSAFANIFKKLNVNYCLAKTSSDLQGSSKLVLPGVGAFDYAMKKFNDSGLRDTVNEMVLAKSCPVLGVCVGMQMMASASEEGIEPGLNWIEGTVRKIDASRLKHKPKLPHMGWNQVRPTDSDSLFNDIDHTLGFYFLHSYFYDCDDSENVLANSDYGVEFACAVNRHNIYGVQFHPEKSLTNGIQLLKNFASK